MTTMVEVLNHVSQKAKQGDFTRCEDKLGYRVYLRYTVEINRM